MQLVYFHASNINKNSGACSFINQLILYLNNSRICSSTNSWHSSSVIFMSGEAVSIRLILYSLCLRKHFVYRVDGMRRPFYEIYESVILSLNGNASLSLFFCIDLLKNIFRNSKALFAYLIASTVIHQSDFIEETWSMYYFIAKLINRRKRRFTVLNASLNISEKTVACCIQRPFIRLVYSKGTLPFKSHTMLSLFNYLIQTDLDKDTLPVHLDCFGGIQKLCCNKQLFNLSSSLTKHSVKFHGLVRRDEYLMILHSNQYDAFVLLEDFAPCPNAVIESYALGLPVIGPNSGSFPQLSISHDFILPTKITSDAWHLVLQNIKSIDKNRTIKHAETALSKTCFSAYENILGSAM